MESALTLFISTGIVTSLLFSELFGIAAGGLIVPGYMAAYLDQPLTTALTIGVGFLTYLIVKVVSSFAIVYGRRRVAVTILLGFVLGMLARYILDITTDGQVEMTVIGYIIPGLMALWMDRQGPVETTSAMLTAAIVVRLAMILITGGEF